MHLTSGNCCETLTPLPNIHHSKNLIWLRISHLQMKPQASSGEKSHLHRQRWGPARWSLFFQTRTSKHKFMSSPLLHGGWGRQVPRNGLIRAIGCHLHHKIQTHIVVTMKQGSPLLAAFKILTVDTFAVIWTENVCLEALTVLLQAAWLLTMAPLVVFTYQWLLSNILLQTKESTGSE
jgi:hypothetical protein